MGGIAYDVYLLSGSCALRGNQGQLGFLVLGVLRVTEDTKQMQYRRRCHIALRQSHLSEDYIEFRVLTLVNILQTKPELM